MNVVRTKNGLVAVTHARILPLAKCTSVLPCSNLWECVFVKTAIVCHMENVCPNINVRSRKLIGQTGHRGPTAQKHVVRNLRAVELAKIDNLASSTFTVQRAMNSPKNQRVNL